ncbi:efflux RND transporter periplasmic adaptor subunit [Leptospira sp. 201903071]|uniref:efflux RND transporter periplasmic adaptor subunit n=1 Tax=Leptospira ainazelensis TaxID=2810034 RepID=UPI0019664600|nr:efflux RND transporter periplasmic adaptor subunit [Leptospira ainazelensis]MBM9502907.1 efflux RND transporter periplasmic adaptor subunit [Leptospira ainazelensis]
MGIGIGFKNRKTLFWIIGLGFLIAFTFFVIFPKIRSGLKAATNKKVSVKVIQAKSVEVFPSIESTGSIEPEEKLELYFKVPGRLDKTFAEEGDRVKQGKLLASLEKFSLEQEKNRYEASLDSAKANLKLAGEKYEKAKKGVEARFIEIKKQTELVHKYKEEYEKAKKTYEAKEAVVKDGGLSQEELNVSRVEVVSRSAAYENAKRDLEIFQIGMRDSDIKDSGFEIPKTESKRLTVLKEIGTKIEKAEVEVASASVRSTEALLTSAKQNLKEADLYSPMDGTIIRKLKTRGEILNGASAQGQAVFNIAKVDKVFAVYNVSEKDSVHIQKGLNVEVTADIFEDKKFEGVVSRIQEFIEEKTHTLQVSAKISNQDHLLKPGMFVRTKTFKGKKEKVIEIPRSAYTEASEKEGFVFVVRNKIAYKVSVTLHETKGETLLISKGIQEDEFVVVDGISRLKEGSEVEIEESKNAP